MLFLLDTGIVTGATTDSNFPAQRQWGRRWEWRTERLCIKWTDGALAGTLYLKKKDTPDAAVLTAVLLEGFK